MTILHRAGSKHCNADPLSRVPDDTSYCNCYQAGVNPEDLPCQVCKYCTRAQQQWSRFEEEVDDVIPLAVRQIVVPPHPFLTIRALSCDPHYSNDPIPNSPVDASNTVPKSLDDPPSSDDDSFESLDSDTESDDDNGDDTELKQIDHTEKLWVPAYTPRELREFQLSDPNLSFILEWLEKDPTQYDLFLGSPALRYYWLHRDHLEMQNGVLYYQWKGIPNDKLLLVIPYNMREEVLTHCHDMKLGGHLGKDNTLVKVKQSCFWYNMKLDCDLHVKTCAVCNRNKKGLKHHRAPLGKYHAGAPLDRVHIDILGPITTSENGNRYVLMLVDQFTKWLECWPLPNQTAEIVASRVVKGFISRFGCPLEIHSDQGSNFDSALFKSVCSLLEITKTHTTPYRPSTNGQMERYNRTLLQVIRCYIRAKQKIWDQDLEELTAAICCMKNRQTQFTANMMMLGREVRRPIDLMLGIEYANMRQNDPAQWVHKLRETLKQVHEVARTNLKSSIHRQKRDYDLRVNLKKYNIGDVVYKINSASKVGQSKKLQSPWLGPYLIEDSHGTIYKIRSQKKSEWIHHDRLKLCEDAELPPWLRRKRHLVLDLDETIAYDDDEDDNNIPEQELAQSIRDDEDDEFRDPKVNENDNSAVEPAEHLDNSQVDNAPSEELDLVQADDAQVDVESEDTSDESITPMDEASDEPTGFTDLTEDVPDYDLQDFFDRQENSLPMTHIYADVPRTRTGRVTRKPKYLKDYSQ